MPEKSKKTENSEDFDFIAESQLHTEEDTEIGFILHMTETDKKLFPEAQSKKLVKLMAIVRKEECTLIMIGKSRIQ